MSNALLSSVSGMRAHQKMLDVAGNNLANQNTTAYKTSRVTFADLLSETLREASQPTSSIGGTNPQQIGSGVKVASVDRNMSQGSLINTGEPLDMAIEGAGYFALNDGQQDVYTRVGTFAVDSDYYLVDPSTGYRVQRTGSEGVAEGFQEATNNAIRIPYDVALPARGTENVAYTGNLSADESSPTTSVLTSGIQYTVSGAVASGSTKIVDLDQASTFSGTINITGTNPDGTAATAGSLVVDANATLDDLVTEINTAFTGATAGIVNGEIRLTDDSSGFSQTDLKLEVAGGATGTLTLPNYFKILAAGGEVVKNTNLEVFDSQGISHILSAAFVRRDTPNMWDMVVTSVTGDVTLDDRRISGITFNANGSYGGLDETIADPNGARVKVGFAYDNYATKTFDVDLGTVGEFNGLSQFGGSSTVAPSGQDGFASGVLSSLSVARDGILVGVFTNGVRKDVAALKIAVFQNPAGLEGIGGNYYSASANSGEPVPTKALSGGAGAIHGGSLEGSNVEIANEFVNLIQAQNGFQANARTIRVSTDMLKELTNLIR